MKTLIILAIALIAEFIRRMIFHVYMKNPFKKFQIIPSVVIMLAIASVVTNSCWKATVYLLLAICVDLIFFWIEVQITSKKGMKIYSEHSDFFDIAIFIGQYLFLFAVMAICLLL